MVLLGQTFALAERLTSFGKLGYRKWYPQAPDFSPRWQEN